MTYEEALDLINDWWAYYTDRSSTGTITANEMLRLIANHHYKLGFEAGWQSHYDKHGETY